MRSFVLLPAMFAASVGSAQTLLPNMPAPNLDLYAIEKIGGTVYIGVASPR
ncbi:MAG: hypothetical protein IPM68_03240 [Flavobacteriales bacterium]|nr:hypothetical protein [Flavobacteriales bacterium]